MVKMMCLAVFCVCSALAGNLLVNPGFEHWDNDSTPVGWVVESRARAGVFRESDTIYKGAGSVRLLRRYLSAGNNYGLMQRVPVQAGTWYQLSFQAWDDNQEVSLGMGVSWRKQDSSYLSSSGTSYSRDSSGWVGVWDSVRAPAQAAFADVRVRTYAPAGMSQERRCFVDEVWFGTPDPEPETVRVWFAQDSLALRLIDFIGQARYSLDYCHYNSSRSDVVQALLNAHQRGVVVRVITDGDRLNNNWVNLLRANGIAVWSDSLGPNAGSYMHNKFVVRDLADSDSTNDWVWVASYNPNENELRADCALEIPVSAVARAYRLEFEQMWGGSGLQPDPTRAKFHTAKRDIQPTHKFEIDGHPAYVYFSPQDRPVDTIARLAAQTRKHLLFGIFSFTHSGLGDAMVARWGESVWVGGVIDRSGVFGQGSQYPKLVANGLPVYEDSVPFGEKIIHEKIMVIDSTITVAGSANWSAAGNASNDENVIIMYSPRIARRFLGELAQRFWEATNPAVKEKEGSGFREGKSFLWPSYACNLLHLPDAALVMDACGRVVKERRTVSSGVYFVLADPADSPAGLRRVVVIR